MSSADGKRRYNYIAAACKGAVKYGHELRYVVESFAVTAVAVGAFGYDVGGVGNILRVAYYRLLGIAYVAGKNYFFGFSVFGDVYCNRRFR